MRLDQIGQTLDIALTQGVIIHLLYLAQAGPTQQGAARLRGLEQTMQIGAEHLTISAYATIGAAIVESHGRVQTCARADPGMNLATADRRVFQAQLAAHIPQWLPGLQPGRETQQPRPRATARRAFQAMGVVDLGTEHLQPAADAQQLAAVTQVPGDGRRPALLAQKSQIAAYAFRAGQD